ncbi:hypothetical protein C0995_015429 [Termitomyces sp. Mi166|nr:hypothetical protein C0995_015429 [Termitomyces sp. Mi166\
MSSGALPDEIIREILTPALRVPDKIFRSTNEVSPFSTYAESSSAFLLVCKSWLRVATPLLYHVVALRSKPQARALERALRGNQILATFIKKLRVEGGFGASMHHILRLGKNIEEIWLILNIWSADSVTGLCSGLPLANPRRLIFFLGDAGENAPTRKLLNTVCECITTWKRLSTVDLSLHGVRTWRIAKSTLLLALHKSESLKTITLTEPQSDPTLLLSLAKIPSLEVIHIVDDGNYTSHWMKSPGMKEVLADERQGELFRYGCMDGGDNMDVTDELTHDEQVNPSKEDLMTFDPSFVALQSTTEEVKTKIWSNIVYFSLLATDPNSDAERRRLEARSRFSSETSLNSKCIAQILRTNILLVSKLFYNTAMRHYYRYFTVGGQDKLTIFEDRISRNPSLGSAIHHLEISFCWGVAEYFRPVLVNATNLVHLTSIRSRDVSLDYQSLVTLAAQVGSKLQTLTGFAIARPSSPKSPTPLYAFTALRALDWDSSMRLKFEHEDVPTDALPCLERLSFVSSNDTFLRLLECMTSVEF